MKPNQDQEIHYNLIMPKPVMPPFEPDRGFTGRKESVMSGQAVTGTLFTITNNGLADIGQNFVSCLGTVGEVGNLTLPIPETIVHSESSLARNNSESFMCFLGLKRMFKSEVLPIPLVCADVIIKFEYALAGRTLAENYNRKFFRFVAASGTWVPVKVDRETKYCTSEGVENLEPEIN
jgi:hypothetical protein